MRRCLALAALVAVTAAGCRGEQGPVSGELAVRLVTPRSSDRAVEFLVAGKLNGVTAPAGSAYRVFADSASGADTTRVAVVAPSGSGLVAGEIARFRVNDTRQVLHYAARVIALAAATYELADTTGVALTVVRP
jgi:type IV pilus biogenesis protein CpaD/CtpE